MSTSEERRGLLGALRASARAALGRLAAADETAAPTASHSPSPAGADEANRFFADPTRALFPSGETAPDEPGAARLPLSSLLDESARAIAYRAQALRDEADGLAMRIAERCAAETTLAAQALRVLIGLGWLGVAGWLFWSVMRARADGLAVAAANTPVADAVVLTSTFLIVAATGLGVAFAVAAIAKLSGNADNERVRAEAERLGAAIADAADDFDRTLTDLRQAMDARARPADAVIDLSRAHVTALEASAFFREIGFLLDADGERAERLFKGFLRRPGAPAPAAPIFAAGALAGALVVYLALAPRPAPVEPAAPLAIMAYPWAAQLIVFGGLLYAAAGALISVFSGAISEGAANRARAEALSALRDGFNTRACVRPADITRRVEDALDVFRARAGSAGGRNMSGEKGRETNHPARELPAESDIPEWRRRDSAVRFVETRFSGAPERWRTDAYAKKIEGAASRKPGSKREPKTP